MIARILSVAVLACSSVAVAAPTWIKVGATSESSAYIDATSVAAADDAVTVRVLRNYDALITLGNDPVTNETWYPHRSVSLDYVANCASGTVALTAWQMFSEKFGDGKLVWAASESDALTFAAPNSLEESSALNAACTSTLRSATEFGSRG